jgi:NADPH:quinone reductase-like Zn-dependent oxidoreductase
MARVVRFQKVGDPEVLKIEEVPLRQPAKVEVTLRVQAVGLNRAEWLFMHGVPGANTAPSCFCNRVPSGFS